MPYKIIVDEVSMLIKTAEFVGHNDEVIYEHIGRVMYYDEIVSDEDISPAIVKKYDDEEPHTRSIIVRVDEDGALVDKPPKKRRSKVVEDTGPKIVSKEGDGSVKNTPLTSDEPDDDDSDDEEDVEETPKIRSRSTVKR